MDPQPVRCWCIREGARRGPTLSKVTTATRTVTGSDVVRAKLNQVGQICVCVCAIWLKKGAEDVEKV
jgi:hypothetical protein